jgi:hypothetical protein
MFELPIEPWNASHRRLGIRFESLLPPTIDDGAVSSPAASCLALYSRFAACLR